MSQPAFDFGAEAADDVDDPTFSVGELAAEINSQLRRGFSDGVWVRGEIDGLRNSGPHTYFSLVEHTERGKAVLQVSLFAPSKRRLTPLLKKHRLELANGMNVRIHGDLDYYAPNGRLGLKMSGIDPRFTLGELSQARDEVVRRLVATGLIDANRRHALSPVPLAVGVVTSVGTAAWHDFHHELEGSGFGFKLSVCDIRVQGDTAVESIAASIRTLARRGDLDCVVVIRGGGARNELATFDAEPIAVAIANCGVPVITGLGHEIDRSVADEVAHTAVKTPTACAGLLIGLVAEYRQQAESRWSQVVASAAQVIGVSSTAISDRARRISGLTQASVHHASERLDGRAQRLTTAAGRQHRDAARHLASGVERLARRSPQVLAAHADRLDQFEARVALLDPINLLRRGWSVTRDEAGAVVRSTNDAVAGQRLFTQVADGELISRIED